MEGLHFSEEVLDNCRNHAINVHIRPILDRLRPLHGMRFAGAGLSIGKDSAVISLKGLINHGLDLALFIEIFLGGVLIEEIIEVELPEGSRLVFDVDFVFIFVDFDEGVFEALFFL